MAKAERKDHEDASQLSSWFNSQKCQKVMSAASRRVSRSFSQFICMFPCRCRREEASLKRNNASFLENKSICSQRPHMPLDDVLIEKISTEAFLWTLFITATTCTLLTQQKPLSALNESFGLWPCTVMLGCHETVWISCLHTLCRMPLCNPQKQTRIIGCNNRRP